MTKWKKNDKVIHLRLLQKVVHLPPMLQDYYRWDLDKCQYIISYILIYL